jgi:putative transposase
VIKDRPPRLEQSFQTYDPPLYFVTACTLHRRKIDNLEDAHVVFRKYAERAAADFDVAVGRYVLMPDHIHFFVRGGAEFHLGKWISGLKRALSIESGATSKTPLWQPGFFDHVLRNDESYGQKWNYVLENPVRAGLVTHAEQWPYQGEIVYIDRA